MNNPSKPSRKITILAICAFLFITALVVNKFWKPGTKTPSLQNISYTTDNLAASENIIEIDADENGMADWRDMLLASTTENAASSTDNAPKTLSESVARSLFASAVYLSNNGQKEIPEEDKEALVNNLVAQLQSSMNFKEYSATGMRINNSSDVATIRAYASRVATLQVGMILEMQKKTAAIQNNISIMGDIYAREAEDLYALEVPSEIAEAHLSIVNNFSRAAASFEAFANEKEDPLKLPFAVQTYQNASAEQTVLLTNVAQFISLNGIIFTSSEIGAYWNAFAS